MKLKDQELGLMIVTLIKGLKELHKLNELPETVFVIYYKMITLLVSIS